MMLPELPELGKRWQMGQKAWHLLSARAENLALPITPSCGKSETLVLFKGHLAHAYFPAWEKVVAKLKSWIFSYLSSSKSQTSSGMRGLCWQLAGWGAGDFRALLKGERISTWMICLENEELTKARPALPPGVGLDKPTLPSVSLVSWQRPRENQQELEVASELLICQGWKASLGMQRPRGRSGRFYVITNLLNLLSPT